MSNSYLTSASCQRDLTYASRLAIPLLPILLEANLDPNSWLGLIVSRWKCLDYSAKDEFSTLQPQVATKAIIKQIHGLASKNESNQVSRIKVKYDFESSSEDELSVKKDEVFELVKIEGDWLRVKSREDGKTGLIPSNYTLNFDGEDDFSESDFHFHELSSTEAEEYLEWAPEGSFLVCDAPKNEFPLQVWKELTHDRSHFSIQLVFFSIIYSSKPLKLFGKDAKRAVSCFASESKTSRINSC